LYFVSTNPDKGITQFTSSYSEFLKFRSEFQAWYRENR
jgi:cell division protein YceG involved in septum cleavage